MFTQEWQASFLWLLCFQLIVLTVNEAVTVGTKPRKYFHWAVTLIVVYVTYCIVWLVALRRCLARPSFVSQSPSIKKTRNNNNNLVATHRAEGSRDTRYIVMVLCLWTFAGPFWGRTPLHPVNRIDCRATIQLMGGQGLRIMPSQAEHGERFLRSLCRPPMNRCLYEWLMRYAYGYRHLMNLFC